MLGLNFAIFAAIFAAGVAAGGGGSWYVQGVRIHDLINQLEAVRVAGHEAQAESDAKVLEFVRNKENSDNDYENKINQLNANIERLRVVHARSNYVPAAPAGSRDTGEACFDRAELERALQQFDAGVTELVKAGDAATIGLNVAREWALANNPPPSH